MYQNASIFQRKKVIFNLGNGKSIINEFNLNTTILFIKIYIRDRLNISNFDLLYNSNPIKSNSIPLYRFFTNINKKSIKFTIKQRKSIENKINIKLYEKEYTKIKNTNIKLMNNIKTYKNNISQVTIKENKNIQRYKSLENLLLRQNEEINRLKKEINDANNRYIKLKQKKPNLKYIESNNNFSIISSKYKIPKCLSMESFNTMYLNNSKNNNTYYRTQNNTNANVSNPKERSSFELIRDLSSIDNNSKINYNYNETNNNLITNYNETSILNMESNPNTYRLTRENYNECSNLFKDYNKISRNENAKKKESIYGLNDNNLDNKNHSVIKYRYQLKEYNINEIRQKYANKNKNENEDNNINVSQNIQEKKEEDKIDFTEIVDCFKQINDINDKIKQRMNNISDRHRINRNFIQIFKYLNCEDIYSFSIVNKSSGVCSYYYLLNIFLNKIDYYNTKYSSLKTRYEELLSSFTKVEVKSNLILSNNSKSGLRILNSPHYINMFNNPIEYFTKNKNGLFIYKILFQFSTNKIPIEDDNLFISKMLEEIKAKTAIKKSIRDFI